MSWALVLGATSGAGEAIARAVALDPGLDVFGVHRGNHHEAAASLRETLEAEGRALHLERMDAGTAEAAAAGVEAMRARAGPASVRLLVHATADGSVGMFTRGARPLDAGRLERTMRSMAHSFVYWVQALQAGGMLHREGAQILGLTSPLGASLIRDTGAISAAKAALEIYVRHLAFELGPLGHRVNLINYGATHSAALDQVLDPVAQARLDARIARMSPAGRRCTVADVAQLVSALAGDRLRWFNGATIDYTGGEIQSLYDVIVHPEELP